MCVISKGEIDGERIVRNDEVVGSIPTSSTNSKHLGHPEKQNLSHLSQKERPGLASTCLGCADKGQGRPFQSGPLDNRQLHVAVNDMGLLPGTSLHPNTKKRAGLFVTPTPKHLFQSRDWFSGLRAASGCGNSGIRPGLPSDKESKTGEYGLASNSNKRGMAQVGVNAFL